MSSCALSGIGLINAGMTDGIAWKESRLKIPIYSVKNRGSVGQWWNALWGGQLVTFPFYWEHLGFGTQSLHLLVLFPLFWVQSQCSTTKKAAFQLWLLSDVIQFFSFSWLLINSHISCKLQTPTLHLLLLNFALNYRWNWWNTLLLILVV